MNVSRRVQLDVICDLLPSEVSAAYSNFIKNNPDRLSPSIKDNSIVLSSGALVNFSADYSLSVIDSRTALIDFIKRYQNSVEWPEGFGALADAEFSIKFNVGPRDPDKDNSPVVGAQVICIKRI